VTGATDLADRALQRLRSGRPKRRVPFTCDLSVDELFLVDQAGLEPLQLVMGCSVISVLDRTIVETGELVFASDALYRARYQAVDDLRREAARLGGHGVVGVRVEIDSEGWGEHLHEFVALGTAVRSRIESLRSGRVPFTSHLSGQALYALLSAGHRPVSLVMGAAVWAVSRWDANWRLAASGRGAELTRLTRELTTAREQAIRRMGTEARAVRAAGVVGVSIEQRAHAWGGSAMEFLALGTAVRRSEGARPPSPRQPRIAVPLDAPSPRAAEIWVDVEPRRRLDH
jgi:uncharacterized protein YbjQ (UPF0145 family)